MSNPRQVKQEERDYFDEHLEEYLSRFCEGRWLAYKRFVAAAVHRLTDGRLTGLDVLDVGCGPLPAFETLAQAARRYVCVDLACRNLLHLVAHVPACLAVLGDAESLPFSKASFDLVVVFGLLHHLPAPDRAVEEIRRVLRPGGIVVVSEPSHHWEGQTARAEGQIATPNERGFTAFEIRALFQRFDFRVHTYGHPFPERVAAFLARRVPFWAAAASPLWRHLFALERRLDALGIRGWDFLLVARDRR